jgi:hypothetical protein
LAADFFAAALPFAFAFFTLTARPPQNLGGAGLQACAQARHFVNGLQPMRYLFKRLRPKHERRAFQRALNRVFLFFFTLYIQNSILQRVIGTYFAELYLPRHQQLAGILKEIGS